MITVTFLGREYRYDMDEQLKTLSGSESILVEDYLGGWAGLQDPKQTTRAGIVLIWLAKRAAGEKATFGEIADTPGLMFGEGVFEIENDGDDPVDPMVVPSARPLAETNGSPGSNGGDPGSADTTETSGSTGLPVSAGSTG